MTLCGGGGGQADREMRDGERYGYVVDGDGPFPDPRSMSQPAGVHGWSQCVDHGRFAVDDDAQWQPPPLAAAMLYELHIGTFSEAGTFDGAIAKLPHLVELGVTHLELMPVCRVLGIARLGIRRRRSVRAAPRLRPAGRSETAGRRLPRIAASRSFSTSSTTTSARPATTSAGSVRTSPIATTRRGVTR